LIRWSGGYTATLENGTETQAEAEMTIAGKSLKESEKAKMSREDACYLVLGQH
jgi:hypothetical protein